MKREDWTLFSTSLPRRGKGDSSMIINSKKKKKKKAQSPS